ncbi:hypothetical protein SCALM49S_04363 [Streptomyces californicus]
MPPTSKPVSAAGSPTKSSIASTSWNTEYRDGGALSLPAGTSRIPATSSPTLTPDSMPPSPALAPCESLISITLTSSPPPTDASLPR